MLRSIRNVKLLKCVSLICLSPLFVFYSSLNYDGPRTNAFLIKLIKHISIITLMIIENRALLGASLYPAIITAR